MCKLSEYTFIHEKKNWKFGGIFGLHFVKMVKKKIEIML